MRSLLRVRPGQKPELRDAEAARTFGWGRDEAEQAIGENLQRMRDLQYKMFAQRRHSVLIVLQAIDGGGKDSTIRRVIGAFNPQGCSVTAFKQPTAIDLQHDFLWRVHQRVPERGTIAVFNRSHYEDVLVARVENLVPREIWSERYARINSFEEVLRESSTKVVKIFLQISRAEQKVRFEERLSAIDKQWKFDPDDLEKRRKWNLYRAAYRDALGRCSTSHAPWYVIPADRKWFRDFVVSQILREELESLPLRWPKLPYDPAKIRVV
ncbi:MAG: polyphosphate kinase 2 family protein [Gammaproteobacteria bacterium]|nr:polyphosphate kinase 2 family protein [Gammaproteobacteria bacterium]